MRHQNRHGVKDLDYHGLK